MHQHKQPEKLVVLLCTGHLLKSEVRSRQADRQTAFSMQECQIRIANERKTIFRETGRMGTETGNGSHQTLHFAFAFSHFHSLFSARKKRKKKKRPAQQQPTALYGTFYWFFGWHYCCTVGTWKLECWKLRWEYSKDEGHFEEKKKGKRRFPSKKGEQWGIKLPLSSD